jgi:hypothetical protein
MNTILHSIRSLLHRRTSRVFAKLYVVALIVLLLPVACFTALQAGLAFVRVEASLSGFIDRVESKIRFENGRWDLKEYSADVSTPHPHGTGGFTDPLYILTADGYVIERVSPIRGFLDSAVYPAQQASPQASTVTTVTNERWRILSEDIIRDGERKGLLLVAYYDPYDQILDRIDSKLNTARDIILGQSRIVNDTIDLQSLDVSKVPYDVSFEVITTANKVVTNNGRIPTRIDPSYVADELRDLRYLRLLRDGERFYLVVSRKIQDDRGNDVGIIFAGRTLTDSVNALLLASAWYFAGSMGISFLLSLLALRYMTMHKDNPLFEVLFRIERSEHPSDVSFEPSSGRISIDGDTIVELPPGTHQHSLAETLLTNPAKEWETEELARRMGLEYTDTTWRTLYDTGLIINRKVGFKLIEYVNKRFAINLKVRTSVG